tara:strand:+ start:151 stop:540 length:390 start_codon:yes stop_codon:yes gene_type:complete
MLINNAWAQGAEVAAPAMGLGSWMPLILVFAVFYFLVIRPQNKRMKEHQEMVASLGRNDRVVTTGGLHGKIAKVVDENTVELEIADGVKVTLNRNSISAMVEKKPGKGSDDQQNTKSKTKGKTKGKKAA